MYNLEKKKSQQAPGGILFPAKMDTLVTEGEHAEMTQYYGAQTYRIDDWDVMVGG